MKGFGLIDEIVPEPVGGAHWSYTDAAALLKEQIILALASVKDIAPATRVENRIEKYSKMGFWEEA
jgi:acetyl-CoA carboxylase carboxyl transferase subunit alpha